MTDKLLTVDEAAERLGTSPRFVRRLISERRIVFVRMGRKGSPVRITESDLEAFIESARVEPMRVPNLRSSARGIA
jgi:excisionase family DNA binding protein